MCNFDYLNNRETRFYSSTEIKNSSQKQLDKSVLIRYNIYYLSIKENKQMRQPRAVTDKRYEEKHKEERKAKSLVWGTSVPRQFAEEINEFLSQYGFTKVQLIEAGYKALLDEAAEHDLGLAKIMDGYDDFFESEKK